MTFKEKAPRRKTRLFPRTIGDVVKQATQPLMSKQGKLYSALLRDWPTIVGPARAAVTRPERLQFASSHSNEATLHLAVRPAAAPELTYAIEQMLEQCARYFGYRAITRIVLHANHALAKDEAPSAPAEAPQQTKPTALPSNLPPEMQTVLSRLASHVGSTVVKKDETR